MVRKTVKALALAVVGSAMAFTATSAHGELRRVSVYIEPEYKEVCRKVFHPPVYEWMTERVFLPAVFFAGGCIPAHFETRQHRVLVSDGYYEDVVEQKLVRPGHWETHTERD